jgi:predicted HTH domain antitoxin
MNLELLEDELQAVTQAGAYKSKEEVIGHALEVLLAANLQLRVNTAIELYRQEKVTFSRAAEIAGLEWDAFKEQLREHGVEVTVAESPDEVRAGAALVHRLRAAS